MCFWGVMLFENRKNSPFGCVKKELVPIYSKFNDNNQETDSSGKKSRDLAPLQVSYIRCMILSVLINWTEVSYLYLIYVLTLDSEGSSALFLFVFLSVTEQGST